MSELNRSIREAVNAVDSYPDPREPFEDFLVAVLFTHGCRIDPDIQISGERVATLSIVLNEYIQT